MYTSRLRDPYGLDLHLGLSESLERLYRPVLPAEGPPLPRMEPPELMAVAFNGPMDLTAFANTRRTRELGQSPARTQPPCQRSTAGHHC